MAEKSGLIKVFDSLTDTTPTTFADLRTQVDDYWDRGLLGLALPPGFPTRPRTSTCSTPTTRRSVGRRPSWSDACPTPPGPTTDGCVVSARLSRLQASGNAMTGTEQVLINDWCQQFPSHSIGTLRFGPDGVPLRGRRRRRQLQRRRLRAVRRLGRQPDAQEPLRRPARRRRRYRDPADGRGRCPALAGPAHDAR